MGDSSRALCSPDFLVGQHPEWEAEMECPKCGDSCTRIEISLKDEDSMQFFSCRRCEAKWWEHQGGTIELDEVLYLTTNQGAY